MSVISVEIRSHHPILMVTPTYFTSGVACGIIDGHPGSVSIQAQNQAGDNESESKISEETFDWLFHAMFVE